MVRDHISIACVCVLATWWVASADTIYTLNIFHHMITRAPEWKALQPHQRHIYIYIYAQRGVECGKTPPTIRGGMCARLSASDAEEDEPRLTNYNHLRGRQVHAWMALQVYNLSGHGWCRWDFNRLSPTRGEGASICVYSLRDVGLLNE